MTNEFTNPYAGCHKESDRPTRLNLDIRTEDYDFINDLRKRQGTMTATFGIIFQKLVNELKKRGIHDITKRREFEHFIINFEFHLDGGPTRRTDGEASAPNDNRREEGTCAGDTETKNEQSGTQGSNVEPKAKGSKRTKQQRV